MFNLGGAELLIILLVLVPMGVTIWGIVDAASRPEVAWQAAGQNKLLWVFLQALGVAPFLLVGFISAVVYLVAIRPKVRSADGWA